MRSGGSSPPTLYSLVFGSFPPLPLFGFCAHSIQACPDLNWFAWAIVTQLPGKNDFAFHQIRKAAWGLCWIVDSSLWKICSEDQQHIAVWKIRNICSTLPVVREVENSVFRVNLHHLCQLVLWQEEVVLGFFIFLFFFFSIFSVKSMTCWVCVRYQFISHGFNINVNCSIQQLWGYITDNILT